MSVFDQARGLSAFASVLNEPAATAVSTMSLLWRTAVAVDAPDRQTRRERHCDVTYMIFLMSVLSFDAALPH